MTFRDSQPEATFDRPGTVVVMPCALGLWPALALPFFGPVLG